MSDTIPECYGKLFPDLEKVQTNVTSRGAAFNARVEGWGLGAKTKVTSVDREKFIQCTKCPSYQTCYDLSLAQLALATAVHTRF